MINYAPKDHLRAIKERRLRVAAEKKQKRTRTLSILIIILAVTVLGALSYLLFLKPQPDPVITTYTPMITKTDSAVQWPTLGNAALGAESGGVLAASSDQTPSPTASVAKVITALLVLEKHPLKLDEQGPDIPILQQDVDSYWRYVNGGGSTVPVQAGQSISQYHAMQALLISSANNMADTLAIWAYGSMDAYHEAANAYVNKIGASQTVTADDASGYSSATVSTPSDLVLIGQKAFANPVIRQITNQQTANLPLAGEIHNTNILLGSNGFVGIKTGNTDAAGGCLLAAATREVDGKKITIISAIMKAPTITSALNQTPALMESAFGNLDQITVLKRDEAVGSAKTAWGTQSDIVTSDDLSVLTWKGEAPNILIESSLGTDQHAGRATAVSKFDTEEVGLQIKNELQAPPFSWRLSNVF